MDPDEGLKAILNLVSSHLADQKRGKCGSIAVMTCGIAGSSYSISFTTNQDNTDQKRFR